MKRKKKRSSDREDKSRVEWSSSTSLIQIPFPKPISNTVPGLMKPENAIRQKLEKFLHTVEKPGRYIGGEPLSVIKNPTGISADMALVFPDVYELGMSHNGMRVLYHIINREPSLYAERSFAPMPDMAEKMRQHRVPLYSLETFRPLNSFSAVGISLQTELNFTNVPYVLELSGIPAFSRDRTDTLPLVVGGGPCVSNPEPLADFFDLFALGDGEVLVVPILKTIAEGKREGWSRDEILKQLSRLTGVYVPKFITTETNRLGEIVPTVAGSKGVYASAGIVKRVWTESLAPENHPIAHPVPNIPLVHKRFAVEIMRGCTNGCRFCHGGYWYRPVREMSPDDIVSVSERGLRSSGERELGLLSLSTSDYSRIEELMDCLMGEEAFQSANISVPSLRADSMGRQLAFKLGAVKAGASATLAPETGSERLRRIINKPITDKDIQEAVYNLFEAGYRNVKLYIMVGLPRETLEDMESCCTLISNLKSIAQKFGNRHTIHVNIGIMVPKSSTPMQWVAFITREKAMQRIHLVSDRFRGVSQVRVTWADWEQAYVEALMARGDRSLGRKIFKAYLEGEVFETFTERFDYSRWEKIWRESDFDKDRLFSIRPLEARLPWDHIHAGVSREFLEREYAGIFSENEAATVDCKKGACHNCGIARKKTDLRIAETLKRKLKPSLRIRGPGNVKASQSGPIPSYPYRMVVEKTGLARFISHHIFLYCLENAFRRQGISLKYNGKFNLRPAIKNPGALPLGLESRHELFLTELRRPLADEDWPAKLSAMMPTGIKVTDVARAESCKLPKIASVVYTARLPEGVKLDRAEIESARQKLSCPRKTGMVRLAEEVLELKFKPGLMTAEIRANECGGVLNPFLVLSALTKIPEAEVRTWHICKEEVRLAS